MDLAHQNISGQKILGLKGVRSFVPALRQWLACMPVMTVMDSSYAADILFPLF